MTLETKELVEKILHILEEKKAKDIECLPVTERTTLADYFVVASGSSVIQVKSLGDEITYRLKEDEGLHPYGVEGMSKGRWILIDYGTVVIHIFHHDDRELYQLEEFWREKKLRHPEN